MTPARAALNLSAAMAGLAEAGIPVTGARILVTEGVARWWIRVGPCPVVDLWLAEPGSCPHHLTCDRYGVRVWSRS